MDRQRSPLAHVNYSIFAHIKQHRKERNKSLIVFHALQKNTKPGNKICLLKEDFF